MNRQLFPADDEHNEIERDFGIDERRARTRMFAIAVLFLAIVLAFCVKEANAQTIDLTAAPMSGVGKSTPALTLAVTGAGTRVVTCTASDGWSGVKSPGTSVQPEITATTTYAVSCSAPAIAGVTTAALSWTPPTTFSDGSALTPATDLNGYEINFGASANSLPNVRPHSVPTATGVNVTGLTAGSTYFFCVKAVGKAGTSPCSNAVSRTLAAGVPAWSASKSVTVTITAPPIPTAPTGLVVTDVTAFQITPNADGTLQAASVDLVPLSTRCIDDRCTVETRRQ